VKEFAKRVLTGLCAGPVVVALFYFLSLQWFFLLLFVIAIAAILELMAMAGVAGKHCATLLAAGSFVPLGFRLFSVYAGWMLLSTVLLLLAGALQKERHGKDVNSEILREVSAVLFAQIFIVIPFISLFFLKERNNMYPLILLLALWASDTCAYFFGKSFGKRLLVPHISPKKTWAGLLGAMVGSTVILALGHRLFSFGVLESLGIGVLLGVLGQLGDIFESAGKRVCAVKDSSSLIPGHGGILDRIDSFIFSAPFLYYYMAGMKA
jgi:phosphatidate cytidylyltransferase